RAHGLRHARALLFGGGRVSFNDSWLCVKSPLTTHSSAKLITTHRQNRLTFPRLRLESSTHRSAHFNLNVLSPLLLVSCRAGADSSARRSRKLMQTYDVIVIGSGPAGQRAAIQAA